MKYLDDFLLKDQSAHLFSAELFDPQPVKVISGTISQTEALGPDITKETLSMCLHVDLESNVRFHLISLQQNILAVSAKQTQSLGRQMHLSHKVRLSLTSRILTYWTGEESWMPTGYRKLGCLRKPVSASTS